MELVGARVKLICGKNLMTKISGHWPFKLRNNKRQRISGFHPFIDRSLLALGNCINALAENKTKYVNYRDSKLTRYIILFS